MNDKEAKLGILLCVICVIKLAECKVIPKHDTAPKIRRQDDQLGVTAKPADVPGADAPNAEAPKASAPDAGAPDDGSPDAGSTNAGAPNADAPDAGAPDAGASDAGSPDAGSPDAGSPNAGAPDAGASDTGAHDASAPDAGTPDANAPNTGAPNAGIPNANAPDANDPDTHDANTSAPDVDTPDAHDGNTVAPDVDTPDAHDANTSAPDADKPDAHNTNTGAPDADTPDAHDANTGSPDADSRDAHDANTGAPDADTPDAHDANTGAPDADTPDAHDANTGAPDADTPDAHDANTGAPDKATVAPSPVDGDLEPMSDGKTCWVSLKGNEHYEKMNKLELQYKDVRESYAKNIISQRMDGGLLKSMVKNRGIAERALQNYGGNANEIPAGLNLGSNCLVRMPGSILFFYRLKLRNDTRFIVNFIHNDMNDMTLTLRLSLNDLHLVGEYERALTSREDPSRLFYRPNKGGVEFLLKDVKYKVEGRYRILKDRPHIEHIISDIPPMEILMRYSTESQEKSTPLEPDSIQDYLLRMKNDLDQWLKDYFNDAIMLYGMEEVQKKQNEKIQQYQSEKTALLNDYSEKVIDLLNKRLRELGAASLIMPDFLLTAANGMEVKLYDGAVRNVDTMYRRSVTTGKLASKVRHVDTDIGFSDLKVEYRYDTYVKTGMPPLSGMMVLNAHDITARLALQVVEHNPSTEDLQMSLIQHGKNEPLTIEGPANRIIANFEHLLEHHIISIMSSTLVHHIRSLGRLALCEPKLPSKDAPQKRASDDESEENEGNLIPDHYSDDENKPIDKGPEEEGNDTTEPSKDDSPQENDDSPPPPQENSVDEDSQNPQGDNTNASHEGDVDKNTGDQDDTNQGDQTLNDSANVNPDQDPEESADVDVDKDSKISSNHDFDQSSKDGGGDGLKEADYAFARKESIELELPPKPGSAKGHRLKLDHNEKFSLKKLDSLRRKRFRSLKANTPQK